MTRIKHLPRRPPTGAGVWGPQATRLKTGGWYHLPCLPTPSFNFFANFRFAAQPTFSTHHFNPASASP